MPWGIGGKRESEETFDKRMKARDEWMNEMWKAYRINLGREHDGYWISKDEMTYPQKCLGTGYKPDNPTVKTRGYGAVHNAEGFDHIRYKGDHIDNEKAYCIDCGEKMWAGALSPWHQAAYDGWLRTRYMKQSQRDSWLRHTAKSIKFGRRGNRRILMMDDGALTRDVILGGSGPTAERGYADDYGNPLWFGE